MRNFAHDAPSPSPLPPGERVSNPPPSTGVGKGEGDYILKSHALSYKVSAYMGEWGI